MAPGSSALEVGTKSKYLPAGNPSVTSSHQLPSEVAARPAPHPGAPHPATGERGLRATPSPAFGALSALGLGHSNRCAVVSLCCLCFIFVGDYKAEFILWSGHFTDGHTESMAHSQLQGQ